MSIGWVTILLTVFSNGQIEIDQYYNANSSPFEMYESREACESALTTRALKKSNQWTVYRLEYTDKLSSDLVATQDIPGNVRMIMRCVEIFK